MTPLSEVAADVAQARDYEALAQRLEHCRRPTDAYNLLREAAAALRELVAAGEALHQRVMRADERIVALTAERDQLRAEVERLKEKP